MGKRKVEYPIWPRTQAQLDRWEGQAAGGLCGECTALEDLTPEQRANPDFMAGWSDNGEVSRWETEWIGDM